MLNGAIPVKLDSLDTKIQEDHKAGIIACLMFFAAHPLNRLGVSKIESRQYQSKNLCSIETNTYEN